MSIDTFINDILTLILDRHETQTDASVTRQPVNDTNASKRWPKINLWRVVNSAVLPGLGTKKAILAFQGDPAVNGYDMALGLIWAFMYAPLPSDSAWRMELTRLQSVLV